MESSIKEFFLTYPCKFNHNCYCICCYDTNKLKNRNSIEDYNISSYALQKTLKYFMIPSPKIKCNNKEYDIKFFECRDFYNELLTKTDKS